MSSFALTLRAALPHLIPRSLALGFALLLLPAAGLPAAAQAAAPALRITADVTPSHLAPGDTSGAGAYRITVTNVGSAPTDGSPITIADTLPAGVTPHPGAASTSLFLTLRTAAGSDLEDESLCQPGPPVTCQTLPIASPGGIPPVLEPDGSLTVNVPVDVAAGLDGATVTNDVSVSGGGAPTALTSEQTPVSSAPAPFGFQDSAFSLTDASGNPVTQAGAHPYDLRTGFLLNSASLGGASPLPSASLHDIHVSLPHGLVVNPTATPVRCTEAQLETPVEGPVPNPHLSVPTCPDASAVGIARATALALGASGGSFDAAVYNMVPPPGVPAELAFVIYAGPIYVHILGGVDSAGDYQLTADVRQLQQFGGALGAELDLWGDPSAPAHDQHRGGCVSPGGSPPNGQNPFFTLGDCPVAPDPSPFLTMPSACSGPLQMSFSADSYDDPGNFLSVSHGTEDALGNSVGVSGCSTLDFAPTLTAQPTTNQADSPTGLNVDLKVPQTAGQDILATANLKRTVVDLPAGMAVNPSAADGLGACSPAQIGLITPLGQTPVHFSAAPDTCPDSAKVGIVQIDTPLLPDPLEGSVYLAQQNQNPFPNPSLLALYITVKDPVTGIVIKLPGKVAPDPSTGQLHATFDDTPQLPFSDFRLSFKGGSRATLVTPPTCGTSQTQTQLSPWSAADPNNPTPAETVTSTDSFQISSGPNGTSCVSSLAQLPFGPGFTAGTTNPTAAAFSPFTVSFSREDQDQDLGAITVHTPPGLLGKLAGIPRCGEPQAAQGTCSPTSQIGHVTVAAGAGPTPVFIPEAGRPQDPVYLTGPYKGAPFGLSVVVPAEAGPFNLGTVVTRAAIYVDPHTGQLTIVSDPLPTILQGIPLKVRAVNVTIDRTGFMFNPTSCDPMSVGATITSAQGAAAVLSSRFQAAGCQSLPFKPSFSATTAGSGNFHGASLDVKVTQRPGEAAIHKVDTQLPLALPSRLVTLQKACTQSQFAANPAGCPAGSDVGMATATTPILNVPLTGPAYLVSHGGAAFPDLDIILQGEGVTIDLVGNTDIKKGVTYSRFETVPDAPISSFELKLPSGSGALLAATKSLCAPTNTVTVSKKVTRRVHGHSKRVTVKAKTNVSESLLMPTTITGQNGAVTQQNTKIAVTGCKKAKPKKRAKKSKKKAKPKAHGTRNSR